MSSHAPMPEYEDEYVKERDALLAENQRLREALRNVDKLAATIEAHEGHEDLLVCVDEMLTCAAAIRVLAAVGEE